MKAEQKPRDPRPSPATGREELSFCLSCHLSLMHRQTTWSMRRLRVGMAERGSRCEQVCLEGSEESQLFSPGAGQCFSFLPPSSQVGGYSGVWGPPSVPSLCWEGRGRELH